ncbi:MAG: ATP-binding cassette domain-containing protein [Clostridia bacterium]|nr:ATP-binding cassette domain-containing protein [Clostridia bacterium]
MEIFKIENLTFRYPAASFAAVENISLTIRKGEFITVCGKSGSGKSTLLSLLKPELAPFGDKTGDIHFLGGEYDSTKIGFMLQNPENQIVCDKVWHELAFGLENTGMDTGEIRLRVAEVASYFGIGEWYHKKTTELSGGGKQILSLAAIVALKPSVIILDEPTSMLDPIMAHELLATLKRINTELGITVILSEHRLEEVFGISDRVLVMDGGKALVFDTPKNVAAFLRDNGHDMMLALPAATRIFPEELPLTVCEGKNIIADRKVLNAELCRREEGKEVILSAKDIWFKYDKNEPDILKGFSCEVKCGEIFAIMGGNGAGKSTALSVIAGVLKPYRGKIKRDNEIRTALLPQNPQLLFVGKTVGADLDEISDGIVEMLGVDEISDKHPYDLSGGEIQRAAIAKLLLTNPDVILMDEPTKGLDAHTKQQLGEILTELKSEGKAIVIVSHDLEFCAEFADKGGLFFDGAIVSDGEIHDFFAGKSFYTTAANRIAEEVVPSAVTVSEVSEAIGGKKSAIQKTEKREREQIEKIVAAPTRINKKQHRLHSIISVAILAVLVPLTTFFGLKFTQNEGYYLTSVAVIIEIMAVLAISFERKKPRAELLVLISVLCALGAGGRIAFYAVQSFKPLAAIVIVSGAALGGEVGFLVGALSAFVSNFFFGQGPWTLWQMFAFGMIGLVSGIFSSGVIGKTRVTYAVFGFFAVIIIYSILINATSVLIWEPSPTAELIISSIVLGFPYDLIHAVSTMIFLWLLGVPLTEKIERIKLKKGL